LIAHGIKGFAQQHQAFFFNIDHSPPTSEFPARRSTHVDKKSHGHVALSFFSTDVDTIVAFHARPLLSRSSNNSIEIHLVPVGLPHDATKCRRTQPFEIPPQ
jgi:hypothetical protein